MSKTEGPPRTWCYREIAAILGLPEKRGYEIVSAVAAAWDLEPVTNTWPRTKRLPWDGVAVIAKALNKPIERPDRRSA